MYLGSHAPVDAGVEGAHVAHMIDTPKLQIDNMINIIAIGNRARPVFVLVLF